MIRAAAPLRVALATLVCSCLSALSAGCTSVLPEARAPRTIATGAPAAANEASAQASLDAARAALEPSEGAAEADEPQIDGFTLTPETIHEARIVIARSALVDGNDAKRALEDEDERLREAERILEADRTAKATLHHGAAHR
jgi:hypothetical protein